jgi:hypothetical protein
MEKLTGTSARIIETKRVSCMLFMPMSRRGWSPSIEATNISGICMAPATAALTFSVISFLSVSVDAAEPILPLAPSKYNSRFWLRRNTRSRSNDSGGGVMSSLLILPLRVRGHTAQLTNTLGTMKLGRDDEHRDTSLSSRFIGSNERTPGGDESSSESYIAELKFTNAHK